MTTPPAIARLDHLAVLRVTGPDRVALLQGQSSNDARRVTAARAQLTSFSNPKGRCVAVAVLAAWDDAHLLIVERSIAEALCKRLRMYVLRAKVTADLAPELAAIATPRAPFDGVEELADDWGSAVVDGSLVVAVPVSRAFALTDSARAAALADGSDAWRRGDVAAGLATVVAETVERFVPLWLGLERFGAIDYQKGCYTGQEIVARSHYLGTVKQRLFRARGAAATAPGTKVFAGSDQALGEVAVAAADGSLLFVGRDAPVGAQLALGAPDGPALDRVEACGPSAT